MWKFQIRPAEQKDLERLSFLYAKGFPGYDYEPVQFEYYLTTQLCFLFVSIYSDVVVGYILGHFNPDKSYCYISSLTVHPFFRKKGIGRSLMNQIVEQAKNEKFEKVELAVLAESLPAIRLYKSFGFCEIDRYEGEEGKTFIEMKADLKS